MTPKEGLSVAWAQAQKLRAMQEDKSDVGGMITINWAAKSIVVIYSRTKKGSCFKLQLPYLWTLLS